MEEIVKGLFVLAILAFVVWVCWRGFMVFWRIVQPVRNVVEKHTDEALRRAQLGTLADISKKINRGIDNAVSTTEQTVSSRTGVPLHKSNPYNNFADAPPHPDTHVRCPDCRELVRNDARKCKHCGTALIPQ
jgi:hypothetical protein